jgi:hypothetical protein
MSKSKRAERHGTPARNGSFKFYVRGKREN